MQDINTSFLRRSYEDAWYDYQYSLSHPDVPHVNWLVLTASDERQVEAYRLQLEARREQIP
jgi:fucokinase